MFSFDVFYIKKGTPKKCTVAQLFSQTKDYPHNSIHKAQIGLIFQFIRPILGLYAQFGDMATSTIYLDMVLECILCNVYPHTLPSITDIYNSPIISACIDFNEQITNPLQYIHPIIHLLG